MHQENKGAIAQLPFVRVTLWPIGPQMVPAAAMRNWIQEWRDRKAARARGEAEELFDNFCNLYPESRDTAGTVKQGTDIPAEDVKDIAKGALTSFRQ